MSVRIDYWSNMVRKRPMSTILLDDRIDAIGLPNTQPSPQIQANHVASETDSSIVNVQPSVAHTSGDIESKSIPSVQADCQSIHSLSGRVSLPPHLDAGELQSGIDAYGTIVTATGHTVAETTAANQSSSSVTSVTSVNMLSIFDLTNIGLSATLAIGVFLIVGYVIRHIAGPAAILSIIIAAVCSYLAGSYFAEMNCIAVTPPIISYSADSYNHYASASDTLMPAYVFVHVCIGEFVAYIIGWNLILDYVIAVALAAKGIATYMDVLVFGTDDFAGAAVPAFTPHNWQVLSQHFDFFAFFIPILIAGPLVLAIRKTIWLSLLSVTLTMVTVALVLVAGIFKANMRNWTARIPSTADNATSTTTNIFEMEHFAPYGLDGIIHGAAILTFVFVGFDALVIGTDTNVEYIREFKKTVPASITTVNILSFVCLLGVSVALTLVQAYFMLSSEGSLPLVFNRLGDEWYWATFAVLGCGVLGLFGSLYALMHAILRVIQNMATDGLVFKLFGKLQHNHQASVAVCLMFTLIAALLAGILDMGHLIKLLSMGTLMMFLAISVAIVLVRYTPIVWANNAANEMQNVCNLQPRPRATISLTTILLILFGVFSVALVVIVHIIRRNIVTISNGLVMATVPTIVILMGTLVLAIGMQNIQPLVKRFNVRFNPFLPAVNIFVCIYLLSTFGSVQWLRFLVWMLIGITMYLICMQQNSSGKGAQSDQNNDGIVYDENNLTIVTEVDESTDHNDMVIAAEDKELATTADCLRCVTPDVIPKFDKQMCTDGLVQREKKHNGFENVMGDRNNFDEIVSVESVRDTCIEMKEPNGHIYFIEQVRCVKRASSIVESDESTALQMLDQILRSEDSDASMGMSVVAVESMMFGEDASIDAVVPAICTHPVSGTKTDAGSKTNIQRATSFKALSIIELNATASHSKSSTGVLVAEQKDNDFETTLMRSTSDGIPTAPHFDHALYNSTIRSRHSRCDQFVMIQPKADETIGRSLKPPTTIADVRLKRVQNTQNTREFAQNSVCQSVDDDDMRMATIRERLERIFVRGPQPVVPHTIPIPAPDYPDEPTTPSIQLSSASAPVDVVADEIGSMKQHETPTRPFDTVHKQKALFNDVLKAIRPEIRSSLHRADSNASTSIIFDGIGHDRVERH